MSEKIWREERIKQQQVIQEGALRVKPLLDQLAGLYGKADDTKRMRLTMMRNCLSDLSNQIDAYVALVDKEIDANQGTTKPEHPKSTNVKGRGYKLIEAGVMSPWAALSDDAQVRCLSYLLKKVDEALIVPLGFLHLDKFVAVLGGVFFEIIPI